MKVISLWSGGKDSCFANYKATKLGHSVISLVNFVEPKGINSLSHNLTARMIQKQTESVGIPLFQEAMPKETYREKFIEIMSRFRDENNIEGIVFGDIYLQEHKDWIDKVCKELKLKAVMPLWGANTEKLIHEIVQAGFQAVVVAIRSDSLSKEWLGRKIDQEFVRDIKAMGNIDPCGEKGEFHTFVFDGPIFKKPVSFKEKRKVCRDNRWFLEIC